MIRSLPLSLGVLALAATPAWSQGFDSGSDGSDGALTFPAGATVDFDPQALGLDPDQDHVFHFSSITIPNGTTVRVRSSQLGGQGKPVVWLAQGVVSIAGTLDLSGATGQGGFVIPSESEAGAGGFNGGKGGAATAVPSGGAGPGGGGPGISGQAGGAAGHRLAGANGNLPGTTYGNQFLLPLQGGSGGGGGVVFNGQTSGGGAGGGAILIASSLSVEVTGTINCAGGAGSGQAGGGSGGAIRLVAPSLSGSGALDVRGPRQGAGRGP